MHDMGLEHSVRFLTSGMEVVSLEHALTPRDRDTESTHRKRKVKVNQAKKLICMMLLPGNTCILIKPYKALAMKNHRHPEY